MSAQYRIGRLHGRFVVTWREDGARRRYRLDALTRKEAEAEAADRILRLTTKPVAGGPTVATLWEAYQKAKQGRRVAEAMPHEWKVVGPHFGHLRPDQVTDETCRAHTAKRRTAGKHDGTIWTELGRLRTVFVWAAGKRMIPHAPAVERPPKPAPKGRYLTRAEIDRLLAADCAHHVRLAILLMLGTAARVRAVLELKWERVNLDREIIDLRTDVIGPRKGRAVVPMNAMLRAALSEARNSALSDHVIEWNGEPVRSIRTGFDNATRGAGLVGVSPHTLRHTAAVHMAEAGISIQEIAQYLGHTNTSITFKTYARYSPGHLQKAASVLNFTSVHAIKSA